MANTTSERVPCKVEDCLDNDPPIRGQNYVCLSFISPEDVIVKKEAYFFNRFTSLFAADVKDLFDKLTEKYKDDPATVDMFKNLVDRYDYLFEANLLQEEFELYKSQNSEKLEKDYLEKNNFQTTIRGIKIRGAYETLVEAQKRAEYLKKHDGKFDVYVAEVGCWCPWAPNPSDIKDQEYGETKLNTLMKKYKENLDEKDLFYRKRAEEMKKKAKEQPQLTTGEEVGEGSDSQSTTTGVLAASVVSQDDDPWLKSKVEQAANNAAADSTEPSSSSAE